MAKKLKAKRPAPDEAIKHKELRINIPTEERAPKRMLYPRAQSHVTTSVTPSR